jgi:hypothetical protein
VTSDQRFVTEIFDELFAKNFQQYKQSLDNSFNGDIAGLSALETNRYIDVWDEAN